MTLATLRCCCVLADRLQQGLSFLLLASWGFPKAQPLLSVASTHSTNAGPGLTLGTEVTLTPSYLSR
jgi:hypothetical protein